MQGKLVRYGPGPAHVAFVNDLNRKSASAILLGGLTDGLLFAPFCCSLNSALASKVNVVHPLLTSSHQGWGMGNITRDADELALLAKYLKTEFGCQSIFIFGHSTGCQVSIRYAELHGRAGQDLLPLLKGVILQAPVSDREWLAAQPETAHLLKLAKDMASTGNGGQVCFVAHDIDGAPVSADRYLSLADVNGNEDYFSSDLTEDVLKKRLSGLKHINTLILISGNDEFVPQTVDVRNVSQRLRRAINETSEVCILEGALHNAKDHEEELTKHVVRFVSRLLGDTPQE